MEKNIRTHPLLYYIMRSFVRYTNIFEEDANGVKFLNFDKEINLIDVGASDGIATKFFNGKLSIKNTICNKDLCAILLRFIAMISAVIVLSYLSDI